MSDADGGYNPDWWKDAKAASLARQAAKPAGEAATARPGDAFLIVTEGVVTEPVYFELLFTRLPVLPARVKVMPGDGSDPHSVIESAAREAREQVRKAKKGQLGINEPPKFDQVWAVIDTDVAMRLQRWNDVVQLALARKVRLAYSTPCIEFWFLLHIDGYTTRGDLQMSTMVNGSPVVSGSPAKAAVKNALGREYSTNEGAARAAIGSFIDKWPEAVVNAERVRQHHLDAGTPAPANPSTEMCRLARALNDSLPEPQRLLTRL